MPVVKLSPNIPLQLALLDPEGEIDSAAEKVYYATTAGTLAVSFRVATQINLLDLRAGESFHIVKRSKDGRMAEWSVWLSPQAEQGRAAEEAEDPSELESQLSRSLAAAPPGSLREVKRKPAARVEQPRLFDRGTGTDGRAPQRAALPAIPPQKPIRVQIPYNVAFREAVVFVTAELKQAGEQWNDQAKQDMVSTILIAAAKQGFLSLWERENA